MHKILNFTQHQATIDQKQAGVIDLDSAQREELQKLLTFDFLPSMSDIVDRAIKIALLVDNGAKYAMIGGAPYLMAPLERALLERGITPVYAFSERISIEKQNADGTVTKSNIFKHAGFVFQ